MQNPLASYVSMLEDFLSGRMPALDFERVFLTTYKSDATPWPEKQFEVLDTLFGDVDAFCANDDLREAGDLNEEEFRHRSAKALEALKRIIQASD